GPATAVSRALGIALRRASIIARVVPIGAPLVDVVANVIEPASVGSITPNRLRTGFPARGVVRQRFGWCITPGVEFAFLSPARGSLPFRLGGRSEEHTSELQSRGHLVCRLLLEKKKQ